MPWQSRILFIVFIAFIGLRSCRAHRLSDLDFTDKMIFVMI